MILGSHTLAAEVESFPTNSVESKLAFGEPFTAQKTGGANQLPSA